MSWTNDLTVGFAQLLAAASVAKWDPTGIYADTDTGITIGVIPQAPALLVCLTPYPVDNTPGMVDVTQGLQVRCRGDSDPRTVQGLADAVYEALHGAQPGTVGGILVAQIYRQSALPLGADQLGRWERSENYFIQASRPTAHNTN